tara:strand:- start:2228 stop:3844 length:1617 start_codon:yes stop_codon:yes gene_type:complete
LDLGLTTKLLIMKALKFKKITLLFNIIILFSIVSCEDILDEEPFVEISTESFYQNQSDAIAALNAAYAQLKNGNGYYRQRYLSNLFASSDQGVSSFQHGNFRRGTIDNSDPNLSANWIQIYVAIKDANNVIKRVAETVNIDDEVRNRIIGEAKFLRALHYFNLARSFGEVPLRTEPVQPGEDGLPKSPINEIYDQIIEDLEFATTHCWGFNESRGNLTNETGRVTKASAHAMLAKVYLQMASSKRTALAGNSGNAIYNKLTDSHTSYYQKAKEECDFALAESGYQLVSNIEDWINLFEASNGNNSEMLFDIQGSSIAGQGTAVSNLFSPRNAGLSGGGFGGTNRLQPRFINNNIDKTDLRFQNSIIKEYQDETLTYNITPGSTGYFRTITSTGVTRPTLFVVFTSKYIDTDATTEYTSQQNWHVIRLAEVYLMRAEALAEINQNPAMANTDLTMLRTRVGMPGFVGDAMSMEDFRRAILRERAAELFAEGHRFFDLTRMGVYDELCRVAFGNTIGARGPEDYTWPIPLVESAANPNID